MPVRLARDRSAPPKLTPPQKENYQGWADREAVRRDGIGEVGAAQAGRGEAGAETSRGVHARWQAGDQVRAGQVGMVEVIRREVDTEQAGGRQVAELEVRAGDVRAGAGDRERRGELAGAERQRRKGRWRATSTLTGSRRRDRRRRGRHSSDRGRRGQPTPGPRPGIGCDDPRWGGRRSRTRRSRSRRSPEATVTVPDTANTRATTAADRAANRHTRFPRPHRPLSGDRMGPPLAT